jgi:large subunit ribosomal protein L25
VSSVRVRALPGNLPDVLTYDLSSLVDYDASITVADLTPPEGVTIQAEPTEVIARVLAPRVEEEPVAAEAAEGEAAAEGGEAAAEGGESETSSDDAEG